MNDIKLIQAVPMVRDQTGCWWHPDMPEFDEGEADKFHAWLKEQGLIFSYKDLEYEDDDHPAHIKYFEHGDPDVSEWNPEEPPGEGWFTLYISMHEDGVCWFWVRRPSEES